ncbi:hypothetical protein CBR_g17000 [Chara braunii]|uniref:Uncharacterized protein n=1 Tax=Chara braunii TaxID=69332 RepID=A0A388KUC5_CHABU|nr:hypothetical protein CBR_g17000 [Chara braunii]|eukprot:GBG73657.1 hypothetical protein CBR_g17000 [Chara braunii]
MRWSTTKLQSQGDLVFFTLRRESWWPELKKVVEVMESLYNLLWRMDKDRTAPSNLVESDKLMRRMLGEFVLTTEQRDTVLEKFFEFLSELEADDGSTLDEPVEEKDKTEEELVRELAFTKTPKGRIPKCLEHEDEELEKMKKRVGERESQPVGGQGRLEEDEEDALGQGEEEAEQEIGQPAQQEENMDTQEKEEDDGMDQRKEEMNEGDGEDVEQQEEDPEESGREQQQEMIETSDMEMEKNAPTTVYKRWKRTAEAAGSPENSPDFPANNAEA